MANVNMLTMSLERDRVAVQAILRDMDTSLAGSCLELSSMQDIVVRGLILKLEAILYKRDIVHEETKSDHIKVKVFEPDLLPMLPLSWWDHLKSDLASWILHRSSKQSPWGKLLGRLGGWIDSKVSRIPAPSAFTLRRIPTKTYIHKVTAVCPHIGNHTNTNHHSQFLAFNLVDLRSPDDFYAVPPDPPERDGKISPDSRSRHPPDWDRQRQWREHLFRSHLHALCGQVASVLGPDRAIGDYGYPMANLSRTMEILRDLKNLFDRYGVSL
jgi:hypothetical protein